MRSAHGERRVYDSLLFDGGERNDAVGSSRSAGELEQSGPRHLGELTPRSLNLRAAGIHFCSAIDELIVRVAGLADAAADALRCDTSTASARRGAADLANLFRVLGQRLLCHPYAIVRSSASIYRRVEHDVFARGRFRAAGVALDADATRA